MLRQITKSIGRSQEESEDLHLKGCTMEPKEVNVISRSNRGGIEIGVVEISGQFAPVARCRHLSHSIQNRVDRNPTERNRRQNTGEPAFHNDPPRSQKRKPGNRPSEYQALPSSFTPLGDRTNECCSPIEHTKKQGCQ